jgi:hypothetical protein
MDGSDQEVQQDAFSAVAHTFAENGELNRLTNGRPAWDGVRDLDARIAVEATPATLKKANMIAPTTLLQQPLSVDPVFLQKVASTTSIEEIKIRTMFEMVEQVPIVVQGADFTKKILYLTNEQANRFDSESISKCVETLDLGDPRLVIILSPATGVESQMQAAHPDKVPSAETEYMCSTFQSSEICESDEILVESQVLLFMRTCILPLARQTRAIILVDGKNDCYLSAALANVVLSEQARLGKDCPFSVIATVSEFDVHYQAASADLKSSVAGQLARGSKAWASRMQSMHAHVTSHPGLLQLCDLTAAASRYVVFESMDEHPGGVSKPNSAAKRNFTSTLLQHLTASMPSICIQSHNIECGITHLAQLAAKNIPGDDACDCVFAYMHIHNNHASRATLPPKIMCMYA